MIGGITGAAILFVIASGKAGFDTSGGFAANGFGEHSPGGYSLLACLVAEVALTFIFLIVILGATDGRAPKGFAPIAIGLGLTLIHLIGIPVTNLSVNPARSTAPAIFVGGWALAQLWLFWLAPIVGSALAGYASSWIAVGGQEPVVGRRTRHRCNDCLTKAPDTTCRRAAMSKQLHSGTSRGPAIAPVFKSPRVCQQCSQSPTVLLPTNCRL